MSNKIMYIYIYMGISKNRSTPKSSLLLGFSTINHPFSGIPIFGNTHIYIYTSHILSVVPALTQSLRTMQQKFINVGHWRLFQIFEELIILTFMFQMSNVQMAYDNPYITGYYNPLYNPTNRGFEHCSNELVGHFFGGRFSYQSQWQPNFGGLLTIEQILREDSWPNCRISKDYVCI